MYPTPADFYGEICLSKYRFDHFGAHGAFAFPAFMLLCDIILRIMIIEKGNQERLTVVRPIHVLKIVANLLIDQDEPLSPLAGEEATSLPPKDYNQASLRLREFFDVRFLTAVITQITISSIFAALETVCYVFLLFLRASSSNSISDYPNIHHGNI
jgi:hypothetical protein